MKRSGTAAGVMRAAVTAVPSSKRPLTAEQDRTLDRMAGIQQGSPADQLLDKALVKK